MLKSLLIAAAAAATLGVAAPASAAPGPWQNINARQAQLDHRIDMGVRTGRLTRQEAFTLRAEFRNIARIEQVYRRGGLNMAERRDLDRRFDRLEYRLFAELNDRQRQRRFG